MKKIVLILLLFFFQKNMVFGQNVSVSFPAYNIIYVGIDNEINIAVEGYKTEQIVKKIKGGEIFEKDGKTFLKVNRRGDAELYIGVKQNFNTKWLDTIVYRVRDFTDEFEPQLGSLKDGSSYNINTINHNASRIFLTLGHTFVIEGVRGAVTKYSIVLQDSFGFEMMDVEGSNIPQKLKNKIRNMSQGGKIYIYNIYYKVYKGKDTLFKNQSLRKNLEIKVKSDGIPQYYISKNYLKDEIKVSFDEDSTLNYEVRKNIKHGKWTYSGGFQNNWIYMEEQYDSGVLTNYTRYDITGFKTIDLNIPKNADSIFYQEFYTNKKVKREGWIIVNNEDYQFVDEVIDESICGYTDTIFPENPFMDFYSKFKFIPIGKWKEYDVDGKLILDANFIKIFKYRNNQSANIYFTDSYTIMPDGHWNEYDKNGNIWREYFYENGYRK